MITKNNPEIQESDIRLEKYLQQSSRCSCKTIVDHKELLKSKTPEEGSLDTLADVLKAVSVSKRLQILFLLKDGSPRCICELESVLNVSQPTITHHIRILQRAGIIETKRENKWLMCSIKDKMIMNIITSLFNYLESEKRS
ncbi:MAG: ArsR/SmtB family transcription factor [Candidatus Odinarchaeota archaeon]